MTLETKLKTAIITHKQGLIGTGEAVDIIMDHFKSTFLFGQALKSIDYSTYDTELVSRVNREHGIAFVCEDGQVSFAYTEREAVGYA